MSADQTLPFSRVCIYAGAGAGKSTTAAGLFHRFKKERMPCELVGEYVKTWAYQDRKPVGFDQVYLFGKQLHYEDRVLKTGGVDFIITDSPILLSSVYADKYGTPAMSQALRTLALEFDRKYPQLAILLERGDRPYQASGRWGTREDAVSIDQAVKACLVDAGIPYIAVQSGDDDRLHALVAEQLYPSGV